jgi:hypothetical protein
MKKTETKYYCDFCNKECTDKHHKLIIPTIEQLAVNSSITRDVTEYENSSIIKRNKITIDCDYSKKKQEK